MAESEKKILTKSDFKSAIKIATEWQEPRESVIKFLAAAYKLNKMFTIGGIRRPMVTKNRNYHHSGVDLVVDPRAEETLRQQYFAKKEKSK